MGQVRFSAVFLLFCAVFLLFCAVFPAENAASQLHGQLAQPLREKALADFKAGALHVRFYT